MQEFDANQYFADRLSKSLNSADGQTTDPSQALRTLESSNPFSSESSESSEALTAATDPGIPGQALSPAEKVRVLENASKKRTAILTEAGRRTQQSLLDNRNSISRKLGLRGTAAGAAVDLVAEGVAGAARIPANIASSIVSLKGTADLANVPDEAIQAYERFLKNEHTPEDTALLNGQETMAQRSPTGQVIREEPTGKTYFEALQAASKTHDYADEVREKSDLSFLVDREDQEQIADDLGNNFESNKNQLNEAANQLEAGNYTDATTGAISGLTGFLTDIGAAAWDHPKAVSEFIVSNIPQILLASTGAGGMAATNVPYAIDSYSQGIQQYKKDNNGALPPKDELTRMAAMAATLAIAETVGDKMILGAGKLANSEKAVARVTGKVGQGSAGEFLTEGYQTYAEASIKGQEASAADIYTGGAIGALAGGGLSGGQAVVQEGAIAIDEARKEYQEELKKGLDTEALRTETNEVVSSAASTGDVSKLLDEDSKHYNPTKAAHALQLFANKPGTPTETKKESLDTALGLVAQLEKQKQFAEEAVKGTTEEGLVEVLETKKNDLTAFEEKAKSGESVAVKNAAAAKEIIDLLEEDLQAIRDGTSTAEDLETARVAAEKQVADLDNHIAATHNAIQDIQEQINLPQTDTSTPVSDSTGTSEASESSDVPAKKVAIKDTKTSPVEASINIITDKASTPEQVQTESNKLIKSMMSDIDLLDSSSAEELASNKNINLTQEQRNYFRAFSEAKVQENRAKDGNEVRRQVIDGGPGFTGLNQYRDLVHAAISTNNREAAEDALSKLANFARTQSSKARAANEAFQKGLGGQIVRTSKGTWEISESKLTDEKIAKNGGLTINTEKLPRSLLKEAEFISAVLAELEAVYALSRSGQLETKGAKETKETTFDDLPGEEAPSETQSAVSAPADTARQSSEETQEKTEKAQNTENTENTETDETDSVDLATNEETAEIEFVQNGGALRQDLEPAPKGAPFKTLNLFKQFFRTEDKAEGETSLRPLAHVNNFMSELLAGNVRVTDYLGDKAITEQQKSVIRLFFTKAKSWNKLIGKAVAVSKYDQFYFKDLSQFFVLKGENQTDGDFEENLKTAISYAAFSYITENADRYERFPQLSNAKTLSDFEKLNESDYGKLLEHGDRQSVLMNNLGKKIIQALGIKDNKDAYANLAPQLESALGAHALKLLLEGKVLTRVSIPGKVMAKLVRESETFTSVTNENAEFPFYVFSQDDQGKLPEVVQEITGESVGTQGILDKLFSTESEFIEPSLEPIPFEQKTVKGRQQLIPGFLRKAIAEKQQEANYFKMDMETVYNKVSNDGLLALAGAEHLDEEISHTTRIRSRESKNNGLQREIDLLKAFRSKMSDPEAPIFFKYAVWVQQRVGIATNVINPQTSKIHRHALYRKEWESVVNLDNQEEMDNFKLRVLEGLGVKTDKQSNQTSLSHPEKNFEAKFAKGTVLSDAVDVLIEVIYADKDMSPEMENILVDAVQEGGENMHSLDVLVAMAHYRHAETNPNLSSFTSTLMGEVDGVTNGPMLSLLLMGAADGANALFDFLRRGGFYPADEGTQDYNVWREQPGNLDIYEATIAAVNSSIVASINAPKTKWLAPRFSAIFAFTGILHDGKQVTKQGRNIIKTPLTSMVFGSSLTKGVSNMADEFIESIYTAIEDQVRNGSSDENRKEIIKNINTLLKAGKYGGDLVGNLSEQQLLKLALDGLKGEAIKNAFIDTVGTHIKEVMKSEFANFLDKRDELNNGAQAAFNIYRIIADKVKKDFIASLVKSGEIETNPNTGEPLHDLNRKQQASLDKRLARLKPIMHTPMSKAGGDLRAGLGMFKTGTGLSGSSTYQTKTTFGTKVKGTFARFNNKKQSVDQKSLTGHGFSFEELNPGVAMMVLSAHSADSAISHYAGLNAEVLNIHDAHGTGLTTFTRTAQNLNKAVWEVMLNYSPAQEVNESLIRTLHEFARMIKAKEIDPDTASLVMEALLENYGDTEDSLFTLVDDMHILAYRADKTKFETMSQTGAINQYALEGGAYIVTDKDQSAARDALASLDSKLPSTVLRDIETVLDYLPDSVRESHDHRKAENQAEHGPVGEAGRSEATTGKFNTKEGLFQLGESPKGQNKSLTALFTNTPELSGNEALRLLWSSLSKDNKSVNPKMKEFYRAVIQQLSQTMPNGVKVRYVTPGTLDQISEYPDHPAHGWYNEGTGEIVILGNGFVHSHVDAEVILHELIHAATVSVLENPQSQAARELSAELTELMKKAREHVSGLPTKEQSQYAPALSELSEFVSWGMTNQAFQNNVLKQMTYQSKTKGNSLVKGMEAFIDTILKLVFKRTTLKRKAIINSGFSVFLSNVAGVMSAQNLETFPSVKPGSSSGSVVKSQSSIYSMSATEGIDTFTSVEIFEALQDGNISSAHESKLSGLLGSIVTKIQGPFGAYTDQIKSGMSEHQNVADTWADAISTGKVPFASQTIAHLPTSRQESFALDQVEAVVRSALESQGMSVSIAYKELNKLYEHAKKNLTPQSFFKGDWSKATAAEKEKAQEQYDFVFEPQLNSVKPSKVDKAEHSDYLSRFAALGLAHESVSQILGTVPTELVQDKEAVRSFAQRIQEIFEKILTYFHEHMTGTFSGQPPADRLNTLVQELIRIDEKGKNQLKRHSAVSEFLDSVDAAVSGASNKARDTVVAVAHSPTVRENSFAVVRASGAVTRVIAGDRVDQFMNGIKKLRDKSFKGRVNVVSGILNDAIGSPEMLQKLLRGTKNIERERAAVSLQASTASLEAFNDKGKNLTGEEKSALSAVFLRLGMHNLLDTYSLKNMVGLLSDDAQLEKATVSIENQLKQLGQVGNYYIHQANALAYYKATGSVRQQFMMMNTRTISNLVGFNQDVEITEQQMTQSEPLIAQLVSLYGLGYMGSVHKTNALNVLSQENSRVGGENGVEFLLKLHKQLEKESIERLFDGDPHFMAHGYTPEIYDPHRAVTVASEQDGQDLLDQGYIQVRRAPIDPTRTNKENNSLYLLKDGGLQPHLSGILSYTAKQNKGSTAQNQQVSLVERNKMTYQHKKAISRMLKTPIREDLSQAGHEFMVPVVKPDGVVSDWRYMMSESTKDDVLKRDNRFDQIIGRTASSIYDKETSAKQNREAVQTLKDIFDEEYPDNPESFIKISPRSRDPEFQEVWAKIPAETRRAIEKVWGYKGLYVKRDQLDIVFGYRKYSLAEVFGKNSDELNPVEKVFKMVVEFTLRTYARSVKGMNEDDAERFTRRAAILVTRGERVWQEIVREVKDIIVVKSAVVLFGNIISNLNFLVIEGVPLKDMVKHHAVALKAATSYQQDTAALAHYQALLDTGYTQGKDREIKASIAKLRDALAKNPIKELIDAGLMPTIAEDVQTGDDPYSYKSLLIRKTESFTNKLPSSVKKAGKIAYVAHDTPLYQGLSRITQLSDFVARYTLHQHTTTRKKNRLTKEDAIQHAAEAFVNYDIPSHRSIQYLDDMGLLMFIKYATRIQKVLLRTTKEHPSRVLSFMLLSNLMDVGPHVFEGSIFNRLGRNPFDLGALKFPGVLDDLITMRTAAALIK